MSNWIFLKITICCLEKIHLQYQATEAESEKNGKRYTTKILTRKIFQWQHQIKYILKQGASVKTKRDISQLLTFYFISIYIYPSRVFPVHLYTCVYTHVFSKFIHIFPLPIFT